MLITDVVRGDFRAMITNDLLKDFDITKDELFEIALANIPEDEAAKVLPAAVRFVTSTYQEEITQEKEAGHVL